MTFQDELDCLNAFAPPNSDKVVRLAFQQNQGHFKGDFVHECVENYRRRVLAALATGDKFTPLERLAVTLLRDSAGLPPIESK